MRREFRHASSFFWIAELRGLIQRYDEVLAEMIDTDEMESHRIKSDERRKLLGVSYLIEASTLQMNWTCAKRRTT